MRRQFGDRPGREEYVRRFGLGPAEAAALFDAVDADLAAEEGLVAVEAAAPVSTLDLVQALKQARLLDAPQLGDGGWGESGVADAATLSRHLLDRGWLTALQANSLLQDRAADLGVGPYLLLDRLGQGWSSYVYRARHRQLNRLVAPKIPQGTDAELDPSEPAVSPGNSGDGTHGPSECHPRHDAADWRHTSWPWSMWKASILPASSPAITYPWRRHARTFVRRRSVCSMHECGQLSRSQASNLLLEVASAKSVWTSRFCMARLHLTAPGHSHSCLTNDGDFMGTPTT